jgi:hypothetical protein
MHIHSGTTSSTGREPRLERLYRIGGIAGIEGALVTFVLGILHPKGTSDVGSVTEWMSRVHASDVWIVVHFALAVASVLALAALVAIARSYPRTTRPPGSE